ncbi:beta-N-acetylglucosaminidase domain-containing protein [Streptomyces sp. NPDC059176]|uniref:beta-N-acetylglucosaminidase domain-containing protein n=1 Tax=unclassified Streptomyces TaxID=2593676 RepID=UPI0036B07AC3
MTFGSISPNTKATWRTRAARAMALLLNPPRHGGASRSAAVTSRADPAAREADGPTASPASPSDPSSLVPRPRSVRWLPGTVPVPERVTAVVGSATDAPALDVLQDALHAAGVRVVRRIDDRTDPGPGLAVLVGGAKENAATRASLDALGVQGAEAMAAEGYVLVVRNDRIVLAGADAAGTYYAAQTLRTLLRSRPAGTRGRLPAVEIRDWPGMRLRGITEGPPGPPRSHAERLACLDWMGRNKLNLYVHAPQDDPYLHAAWRTPYPAHELARLGELVRRAGSHHIDVRCVVSPGPSLRCSDPAEAAALSAKFGALWGIGVRTFAVSFDRADPLVGCNGSDRRAFGTGPAAAAAAQAYFANAVLREFAAAHPGAAAPDVVPSESWDAAGPDYALRLARDLDASVTVHWAVGGAARPVTRAEVAAARAVLGHALLLRNGPPADGPAPRRRLPRPYTGRDAGLAAPGRPGVAVGVAAEAVRDAWGAPHGPRTFADYAWNDAEYDPERSCAVRSS